MQNLLKVLFLLTGLATIFAICPDNPLPPGTFISSDNPLTLTRASPGMTNFPTSTSQLSIALTVDPVDGCVSRTVFNLFTYTVTPPNGTPITLLRARVDCTTFIVNFQNQFFPSLPLKAYDSTPRGPISIFASYDIKNGQLSTAVQTATSTRFASLSVTPRTLVFDANTKINICSDASGRIPISCTVSALQFDYRYFGGSDISKAHLGGTTPSLAASYPFTDAPATSLVDKTGSGRSGYFGDSASSPTAGTTPSWDPSNKFVQIRSSTQFLTFPLPPLLPGTITTSLNFAVAAWIRIPSIPQTEVTLLTTYGPNGNEFIRFTVSQSTATIRYSLNNQPLKSGNSQISITPNTWQLFGFTVALRNDGRYLTGTVFVGSSSFAFSEESQVQLSAPTLMRVGSATNSFIGDVANVRIMSPGGGYISTGDNVCSPTNSIELGSGPFSLDCSSSSGKLNFDDNTCSATCPSGTQSFEGSAIPFCASPTCPSNCKTCDSTGCLTCEDNFLLYKGACTSSCPERTYSTGNICKECSQSCQKCDSTGCSQCVSDYFLYNKGCVNPCPAKTYSTGSTCESCSAKCETCDSEGCLTCEADYLLYSDYCVDSCPEKTYSTGSTCEDCPIKCKTCNSKRCILCDPAYSSKKIKSKNSSEL